MVKITYYRIFHTNKSENISQRWTNNSIGKAIK